MNKIIIHGRLTKNPEIRTVGEHNVANFCVAVNRRFDRNATDFFECAAWGKSADFMKQYFPKGSEICLSGEMQSRKYQARDGANRIAWTVRVDEIDFCGAARDHQCDAGRSAAAQEEAFAGAEEASDEELPF